MVLTEVAPLAAVIGIGKVIPVATNESRRSDTPSGQCTVARCSESKLKLGMGVERAKLKLGVVTAIITSLQRNRPWDAAALPRRMPTIRRPGMRTSTCDEAAPATMVPPRGPRVTSTCDFALVVSSGASFVAALRADAIDSASTSLLRSNSSE